MRGNDGGGGDYLKDKRPSEGFVGTVAPVGQRKSEERGPPAAGRARPWGIRGALLALVGRVSPLCGPFKNLSGKNVILPSALA